MSQTTQLAAEYAAHDDAEELLESALKKVKATKAGVEAALVASMTQDEMTSMHTKELGQFIVQPFTSPSLGDKEREADMLAWLRGLGYGGLIREQIHSSSLKATINEVIKSGEPLPSYIRVFEGLRISRRKN